MKEGQAIADKIGRLYGAGYDWNSEITVTAGATQAIFTAVLAIVRPGDEVIVIEPVYDSYIPNIELAGGVPVVWGGSNDSSTKAAVLARLMVVAPPDTVSGYDVSSPESAVTY